MARILSNRQIEEFANHLKNEEKSRNTIDKYVRDTRAFAEYANGCEITKDIVLSYKIELQRKYAAGSVNSVLAAINSLLAFLGWRDLKIKSVKFQQKIFCPEEKELTKAEYARLCTAAEEKHNSRLSLILQTVAATGIRISELKYITVEAAKKGEATVNCKGKTRTVIIVDKLKRKLLGYAKSRKIESGMIFITKSGKSVDRTNIWREMKNLCEEAEVNPEKVFPHNLRHLFARTFYGMDKDIAKLADILGHSSINTTRIYIISTGAEHRRLMENMRLII